MNLCFIMGKIISDIEFKFIINSINISVAIYGSLNKEMEVIIKAIKL